MYDPARVVASRVLIVTTNDSGTEQYHQVEGLTGEAFAKVLATRQHGFSSHPPDGSHGIMVALNGRRDLCVVLGGEAGDHRPTGTPPGGSVMYDTAGSSIALDAAGGAMVQAKGTVTVKVGGVTFTVSPGGVDISGGKVTHNGRNIGSDHVHGEVMGGEGTTGDPQ